MIYFSKDQKNISHAVKETLVNNIKLFASQIPFDFLSFRQFSHLMTKVSSSQFFDIEIIKGKLNLLKSQVEESEGEM